MSEDECLYSILGVPRNASSDQIRTAFKKQALRHHPDKSDAANRDMFEKVHMAYTILRDPDTKIQYDESIENTDDHIDQWMNVFLDIMKLQFSHAKKRPTHETKHDITLNVNVSLLEVYCGDIKKVVTKVKRNGEWAKVPLYLNLLEKKRRFVFPNQGDDNKGDVIANVCITCPANIFICENDRDILMYHHTDLYTYLYGGTLSIRFIDGDVIESSLSSYVDRDNDMMIVVDHGLPYIQGNQILYGHLFIHVMLHVTSEQLQRGNLSALIKDYCHKNEETSEICNKDSELS
jgi:DnaJ-class molecular chaperone